MSIDDFKNGFGLGVLWALRQDVNDSLPRRAGEYIRSLPETGVQESINHVIADLVNSDKQEPAA